ncbi:hypothetical protein [Lentibacillus cibarius]|nr:hypothetical protein [Lentibacillus cibarius]
MKSVIVNDSGARKQLEVGERPKPEAGGENLLINVHMAAVNRTDHYKR